MSLRKSPALTPALMAANRRNAQKSTGPRTARGKAQVRMNALRGGQRSRLWQDFLGAVLDAPPGGVEAVVRSRLTPDLARQDHFRDLAEIAIELGLPPGDRLRSIRAVCRQTQKEDYLIFSDQTRNVYENKHPSKPIRASSSDIIEK